MSISIVPIGRCFAGEVSGVDLRRPLSPETVAAIDSGMDEYAVLVFRGQDISDEEQLAFSRAPGVKNPNRRIWLRLKNQSRYENVR